MYIMYVYIYTYTLVCILSITHKQSNEVREIRNDILQNNQVKQIEHVQTKAWTFQ